MNPRVGWVAVVLAAMVMGAAGAYAQDTALETSSWSLEFGTSVGFESGFSSTIAIRRHMSPSSALRIGLGGTFNKADGDGELTNPPNPTLDLRRTNTFYSYQALLQWIHYATVTDRVAAQFGIGPMLEVFRSSNRNTEDFGLPTFDENESSSSQTAYGLGLSLGVEWFFTRRLSLGGRTSVEALMGTRKESFLSRSTTSRFESQSESDVTIFRSGGGNIYLTGYF